MVLKLVVGNLEGNKVKNEEKGPKIVWLRRGEGLDLILRREDSQREGDSIWFLEGGTHKGGFNPRVQLWDPGYGNFKNP